ncbi:glycosyltransferase family 2 protein [Paramicrobacterium agarici]
MVDNNSTDGTREFLADYEDAELEVVTLDQNLGGAGGFEIGMERAYELGADFVWVMDDDCYPEEGALKQLLSDHAEARNTLDRDVPFACSLVKFIDGSLCEMNNPVTSWDWPRAFVMGASTFLVCECTFVSVLFPRHVLREHGLPLREYFIWYDDKEYTKRLSAAHGPGVISLESEVIHDMGVNAGVNYRQVNDTNIWKFEKGARNQASYRYHREGGMSYLNYFRRVVVQMRQGKVSKPLRRRMIRALLRGRTFNPSPRFPTERTQ